MTQLTFDTHSIFAYSTIVSVSTQTSTTLVVVVQQNEGAKFSINQQVTLYPANPTTPPYFTFPTKANAMICRVTAITGDQITMDISVGNRESSNIRNVLVGDQIGNYITPKIFTDIEIALNNIPTNPTTTTPGSNPVPPVSGPGAPPAADPVVFTQGNNVFTSTDILADYNSDSPVTVASETVTSVTGGPNPFGTGNALKWVVDATHITQVGVNKDLSLLSTRDFKFKFRLASSGLTFSGEETIFHAWIDNYKKDLIEIRIKPAGSSKFNFLLRAPGADNFASMVNASNVQFSYDTSYDVEFYMTDNSFCLLVGGNLIIEWYSGISTTNQYYAFNNQGVYIGGISIGKFYSTQMVGSFYIRAVNFYQDYVAPTGPSTDADKLADAWAGWKKRYLRSDGAIVRPNPEGKNGQFNAWSDVVSEGVAYGLMFAVQMNDVTTFDLIETWIRANLERVNGSGLTATTLMAWHYDDIGNVVYDWNFATDADMDRVVALIWAAHRKANGNTGWVSSSINYGSKATAVIADLKTYAFRTDAGNGFKYLASDSFQLSADPMEINVSYHSVAAMKIIKNYNSDTFWDAAVSGTYDLLTKMAAKQMTDQHATGEGGAAGVLMQGPLPADWVGYSVSAHDVSQQPPNNREIKYSYDAFRTIPRIFWHFYFFADSRALSYLTGALRTFFNTQWAQLGLIYAEYFHNGTVAGAYEKSMMTFNAYLCGVAFIGSDATAAAIWAAKLANLYAKSYVGGFYRDNPAASGAFVGAPSYFNNSWMLFAMLIKTGAFTNF